MSFVRFNHVFAMLMVLSVVSAFVLSPQTTDGLRAQMQGVFAPISIPTRNLAAGLMHRIITDKPIDDGAGKGETRSMETVLLENQQFRAMVSNLSRQLRELQELNQDRQRVGIVRPYCTPVVVAGADTGARRSLTLQAPPSGELKVGMAVLYPGGLAGRIDRSGVAGAQVKLLNDASSRVEAAFVRYQQRPDGGVEPIPIATPTKPLVVGTGREGMVIRNLAERDVRDTEITVGDWIVLEDPEWPLILQGYPIGRITAIGPLRNSPGFSEIQVQPMGRLMSLREVMVMNRTEPR